MVCCVRFAQQLLQKGGISLLDKVPRGRYLGQVHRAGWSRHNFFPSPCPAVTSTFSLNLLYYRGNCCTPTTRQKGHIICILPFALARSTVHETYWYLLMLSVTPSCVPTTPSHHSRQGWRPPTPQATWFQPECASIYLMSRRLVNGRH